MNRTILYDLPYDVRGFVSEDADGEPIYILNSRLTREANLQTFLHECAHIEHGDLSSNNNVNQIEYERHSK